MDKIKDLQLKKEIIIGMIEVWAELLLKIDKELRIERTKKILKEIKERMYESNEK